MLFLTGAHQCSIGLKSGEYDGKYCKTHPAFSINSLILRPENTNQSVDGCVMGSNCYIVLKILALVHAMESVKT